MTQKTQALTDKPPPHSIEAERAVLGSILTNNHVYLEASTILQDTDFYRNSHRLIWSAMTCLHDQGQPIDAVTLGLQIGPNLERVGDIPYLASLLDYTVHPNHVSAYATAVKGKATLRRLAAASYESLQDCYEPNTEQSEIVARLQKTITDVAQVQKLKKRSIGDIAFDELCRLSEMAQHPEMDRSVKTDFADFDFYSGGLHPGDFILVAGRPAAGKTSFALSLALNVANKGKTVQICEMEMPATQLADRLMCQAGQVDMQKVRTGWLSDQDFEKLRTAQSALDKLPIVISDNVRVTTQQLYAEAVKTKKEQGLDLLLIDYLQLISPPKRAENRQVEVATISRELKSLAVELEIPVIALSQLSRAADTRKEPQMSDLRESGQQEADADIIALLFQDDEESDLVKVKIAKNRNGPIGTFPMTFLRQFTRFENCYVT